MHQHACRGKKPSTAERKLTGKSHQANPQTPLRSAAHRRPRAAWKWLPRAPALRELPLGDPGALQETTAAPEAKPGTFLRTVSYVFPRRRGEKHKLGFGGTASRRD
jgi:hypothetical protein